MSTNSIQCLFSSGFEPMKVLHNEKKKRHCYGGFTAVSVRAVTVCQAGTGGPGVAVCPVRGAPRGFNGRAALN